MDNSARSSPLSFRYSLDDLKRDYQSHAKKHSSIISFTETIEPEYLVRKTSIYQIIPIPEGMSTIFKSSLPIILANCSLFLLNLVNLFYVSKLNDSVETGGIGVSMVMMQCTVYALILSINQGLTVLGSHTFGSKEYYTVGLLYLRANVLIAVVLIFFLPLLLSTRSILITINISPPVAESAQTYALYLIPSLIGFSLYDSTKSYLLCLKKFQPIVYIQLSTFILHCFSGGILINYLGLGVKGAAIARGITDWVNFLIVLGYIKKYEHDDPAFKMTWIEWTKEIFNPKGLLELFKYITGLSSIYFVQQFTYQVFTFLAGQFSDANLAAHILLTNTNSLLSCIPLGISLATAAYVSFSLGEGCFIKVRFFLRSGYCCIFISIIVIVLVFSTFQSIWVQVFSSDPDVSSILDQLVHIYLVGVVPWDSLQTLSATILKSIGKQMQVNIAVFSAYYALALPAAVYFGFGCDMQTRGIWTAISLADIALFIFSTAILWKTDWINQMKEMKRHVAEEQGEELAELRIESSNGSLADPDLAAVLVRGRSLTPQSNVGPMKFDKKEIIKLMTQSQLLH